MEAELRTLFQQLDTNGDKFLDPEEVHWIEAAISQALGWRYSAQSFDRNSDGVLSSDEFGVWMKTHSDAARMPLAELIDQVKTHLLPSASAHPRERSEPNPRIILFAPETVGERAADSFLRAQYHNIGYVDFKVVLQYNIYASTDLGKKAKAAIEKSGRVPDDVALPMALSALEKKTNGWLLVGFPRYLSQAQTLWRSLSERNQQPHAVVQTWFSRPVAKARLGGERICTQDRSHKNNLNIFEIKCDGQKCRECGAAVVQGPERDDATIEKIHDIYYNESEGTTAVCKFFSSLARENKLLYVELNGEGTMESIKTNLLESTAAL